MKNATNPSQYSKGGASQYSVKMTVYDKGIEVSYISAMLMKDMTGTGVQHTYIHKDAEGEIVQINFWGEMNVVPLTKGQKVTTFPATDKELK